MMPTQWALMLPVEITDSNKWLDTNTSSFSIATGTYESMVEVVAAMNTATGGSPSLAIGSTGKITISDVGSFDLEWNTGANAGSNIGEVLGFDVSSDDNGSTSHESDFQHQFAWYSERPPEFDSWDLNIIRGGKVHIAQSRLTKKVSNPNTFWLRETDFALISQEKWHPDYAPTNEAFSDWFETAGRGAEVIIYTDTSTLTRAGKYVLLRPDSNLLAGSSREGPDAPYFNVALQWHKVSS